MALQQASCPRPSEITVTSRIRTAIVEGDLVPNQRLIEADLCTQFDASRTTVRAALAALTIEGLVERIQHRGARVRTFSSAEAVEITELRTVIEGLCAAKAAQNITSTEIEGLTALRAALTTAAAARDILEYFRLGRELHRRIRDLSEHRTAGEILDRLDVRVVHHQSRSHMHPHQMRQSLPEHLRIIDEICARRPEQAEAAMLGHLDRLARGIRLAVESR